MVKLFFIIYIILQLTLANAFADKTAAQSFEDIAAELNAKKESLEPFDPKDVKVDLESLGLDKVEEKSQKEPMPLDLPTLEMPKQPEVKNEEKNIQKPEPEVKKEEKPLKKLGEVAAEKFNQLPSVQMIKESAKKKEASSFKGKSSFLIKETPKNKKAENKKTSKKYIIKKGGQKKRASKEEEIKNLLKLKQHYLQEIIELEEKNKTQESESGLELSTFEDSPIIIPRRKEIGKFDSSEPLPPPIVNSFRTSDNVHIPIPLNNQQRIKNLFDSALENDPSIFDESFKSVGNVNVHNELGDSILTYSILLRKHAIVASILTKGADPNMPNRLGYTPLGIAIELSDPKSLKLLYENKANLDYVDNYGRTYLMQAARVGFLPAVELLVENGANVNALDQDGFTALSAAYRYKNEVIVKYLLKNGAKAWIEKPYEADSQLIMEELKNRWK